MTPVTLDYFHGLALRAAIGRRRNQEEAERVRFREKAKHDRLIFENAIKDMASVAQPELAGTFTR